MGALPYAEFQKIHDRIRARTIRVFCTESRLLKLRDELDLLAFSDIADFDGVKSLSDLRRVAKGKSRAVKKIKASSVTKDDVSYDTVEFELHAKHQAIEQLITIMGIKAPERQEIGGPGMTPLKIVYVEPKKAGETSRVQIKKPGNGSG